MRIFDFESKKEIEVSQYHQKSLSFLYETALGRFFLKFVTLPFISKIYGKYNDSVFSKKKIESFIEEYNIDMSIYEKVDYNNFNEFFYRKIIPSSRPISKKDSDFISCCDSRVMVYPITDDLVFSVKDTQYSVESILQDRELAKKYKNGLCIVLRLCVSDYHRYCFFDSGVVKKRYPIKGKLHTVSPISYSHFKVFQENSREVSILETKNFGTVSQVEVGAIMVGKIINHDIMEFKRGMEKGYFKFGGSTIVLLVEKDKINIDPVILEYSKKGIEVQVQLGSILGKKVK